MKNYKEPASVEEARARLETLHNEIKNIEAQSAARKAKIPTDRKLPPDEWAAYLTWKAQANFARVAKTEEYRKIKDWFRQHNPHAVAFSELRERVGFNQNDPDSLLLYLLDVVHILIKDGVTLEHDEQAVVDSVRDYFERKKSLFDRMNR